ncbi:MAG: hypothetical protein IKG30_00405 [Clostridiales bacterium]|nr:hypothetical protein [Clostridiales bacterium]
MKKTKSAFDTFKEMVIASIKDYLDDSYQDFKLEIKTIKKSGFEYDALLVSPPEEGTKVVPALNLNEAYDFYDKNGSFDETMKKLADIRMKNTNLPGFSKEDIVDFSKIKGKIIPRLINKEANIEYLSDKPHKDIEDLAVFYAARICESDDSFGDAIITNDLLQLWNINEAELHDIAMTNLSQRAPLFINIEDALFGGMDKSSSEIEEIDPDEYNIPYFILTTQQKTKGAVMAINPSVMNRIIAKFGDVYIIPSSVDEVLFTKKSNVEDVQELVRMVTTVNSSDVRPQDRLSDNIYEYDVETQSIKIANNYSAQIA